MNPFKTFIVSSVVAAIAVTSAYLAAFNYQFGSPIPAVYEVSNWMTLKSHAADRVHGKRLLIFGDSSSIFGIDSPLLSQKTGIPVVNMALHGGLPLDAIAKFAMEKSRKGDVVVMPLAWTYYFKDYSTPEDWIIEQMVAWNRGYFDELPVETKLKYLKSVDIKTLYRNVDMKIHKDKILKEFPTRRSLTTEEVEIQHRSFDRATPQPFSYSFLNMNELGDIQNACGHAPAGPMVSFEFPDDPTINPHTAELLRKIASDLHERGVDFHIIPTVMLQDEKSTQEHYRNKISSTMNQIRTLGISVLGDPNSFYYPVSSFYDTSYHINCESKEDRTNKVYEAIKVAI